MAPGDRTALVAGATGLIGGHCLSLLLAEPTYGRVIAVVRRPLGIEHPKLAVRVVDFEQLEKSERIPVDDIYCCLGTTMKRAGSREAFRRVDHDSVIGVARIADARRFLIVSALGANPRSVVFYNRVKGEAEEALAGFRFNALHIFRPSLLIGHRPEVRFGERVGEIAMAALRPLLRGPLRKYRAIRGEAVATAMLRCALSASTGVRIHESDEIQRIADAASMGTHGSA
jgi:uncharacterized protein YbjT (DUF2867 family)